MNNFNDCLKVSENSGLESFWDQIYRKAFPNITNHMRGQSNKCNSQNNGVDRIIYLENGKTLTIEEKVRTATWDDVALEYISNDIKKTDGWIEKDLYVDYLAYAFIPTKIVYLFDWRMLKIAWKENKEHWLNTYYIAKAPNEYYTTYSVCVPIDILYESCKNASIIKL